MSSIVKNELRVGKFTSSKIHILMKSGKGSQVFSVKGHTSTVDDIASVKDLVVVTIKAQFIMEVASVLSPVAVAVDKRFAVLAHAVGVAVGLASVVDGVAVAVRAANELIHEHGPGVSARDVAVLIAPHHLVRANGRRWCEWT